MLVLSRRKNEVLMIGEDIKVMVLGIDSRGNVRIGIEAPRNINIAREEIYKGANDADGDKAKTRDDATPPNVNLQF